MPTPTPRPDPTALLDALRARWGWFVGLGLAFVALGAAAAVHVLAATLASVVVVGALMIVAGAGQLIQAWRVTGWGRFLLWTLSGVLYGGAGLLAIARPEAGAAALTLLLGATLIASGALRLWLWFNHRSQAGWQWLAFSGAITLLAGLLVAAGWPGNSVWLLGMLLAIDLLFQGFTLILFGLALRRRTPD